MTRDEYDNTLPRSVSEMISPGINNPQIARQTRLGVINFRCSASKHL